MREAGERIDWQQAYAVLERARRAMEFGDEPPVEEVQRILRERARALARPLAEAPTPTDVVELLVFALGGERYAIEAAHVLEVVPLGELTPVPGAPAHVLGVVNHRGRILPVMDLRRLLELAGQGVTEGGRVVAVQAGGMTFGILANAVAGLIEVGADEVAPPAPALSRRGQTFVRGVTAEMVALLDLGALARDPGLLVNEEVG